MAHAGMTKDPCPVCKKKPGDKGCEWYERRKDGVCQECWEWIERMREIETEIKNKGKEVRVYQANANYYSLPYIYTHRNNGTNEMGDDLNKLFLALSEAVSLPTIKEDRDAPTLWREFFDRSTSRQWAVYRQFKPEIARLLSELHITVRKAMEEEFRQGQLEGKNALLSLAKGEITSKELDAIGRKDKKC